MTDKMVMVVSEGSFDKALMPLIMGNTAASMGMEVHVFYTFFGLKLLKKGVRPKLKGMMRLFTGMIEKKMKKLKIPAYTEMLDQARELAQTMVEIGTSLNRRTVAVITDMNQPLGHEVGNANEIREAIKVLSNQGCEDEVTVALTIASYMAVLSGVFADFDSAYHELQQIIQSGKAIDKLKELIRLPAGTIIPI